MQPGTIKLLPTGETETVKVGETTIQVPRCTVRIDFKASDRERGIINQIGFERILGSLSTAHGYSLIFDGELVVVWHPSPRPFDSMSPYSVNHLATTESSIRAHLESFMQLYQRNPHFLKGE